MRHLLRDAVHAVRALGARPMVTATTILTLALGIGGTSAMFSIASGLLLRPLPVPEPHRLVRVFGGSDGRALGITSYPNLADLSARARSFSAVAIHQQTFAAYGLGEDTLSVATELVSGRYFETFRVRPALGRGFTAADDARGAATAIAVVSDRWWRSRLGADPAALGRVIHLNGAPFTVIGVAPPSFRGSYDAAATDLWVPLMAYPVVRPRGLDIQRRSWGWLQATARLTDEATLTSANAEVHGIAAALEAEFPSENRGLTFTATPASAAPESLTPLLTRVLVFALVVTALALLAASANVANVQLAAVSDRAAEIAVRMALGATRADVARLWLVESLVVTAAATGLGLLTAVWLRDGFLALQPLTGLDHFAPAADIDWRVWSCAALLMAGATAISGLVPALRAAATDPARPLQEGAGASAGTPRGLWLQAGLVSSQAAVSLTLVAMAGLLGRSLAEATWFDVGFDPTRLVVARANTSGLGLDDARGYAYHADTMARVRALPGVDAVTAASVVPLGGNNEQRGIVIDGYVPPGDGPSFIIDNNIVWPGYFETMGIPLVRGRAFAEQDGRPDAPVVAVVNETMARRYWPGGDAIGTTIRLSEDQRAEVVGVVKDVSVYALGEAPLPYLYLPFGPLPFADGLTFHVRTGLDESVMARQLAAELRRSDPRVRVVNAMAYQDLRAASLFPARAMTALSAGFGTVALLLLLVGTYGVTSFVVARRRREFALRVALGADPSAMRAGVVRRALAWGLPGVLAGAAATAALGRLLQRFLFDVSPLDPWTMAAAALVVLAASALAAYLPARRLALADLAAQLKV